MGGGEGVFTTVIHSNRTVIIPKLQTLYSNDVGSGFRVAVSKYPIAIHFGTICYVKPFLLGEWRGVTLIMPNIAMPG